MTGTSNDLQKHTESSRVMRGAWKAGGRVHAPAQGGAGRARRDCAGILDDGGSGISERELPDGKMGAELADMGGSGRAVPGGQRRLRRAASGARRALTGRTTMNARRCRRRAFRRCLSIGVRNHANPMCCTMNVCGTFTAMRHRDCPMYSLNCIH